ncbi:MAG TPA: AraC family transcriptional regulator ligand-binding domain-containing protein [Polyangiaceae bacterium]|jgi:AraC-like DNA-binding protein|nr:AraC family transcriptional regulator ligand-binding domain-containing protein [Polyangiaceae bacterium]
MSVSVFLVRVLVEAVERSGAEVRAALPAGFRSLDQPHARLDFHAFGELLESAVRSTGDEALGLHLAEKMPEGAADVLAHAAAHAPTMRAAIETCAQYAPLGIEGLLLSTHDEARECIVIHEFPRHSRTTDRVLADFLLAGMARLARTFHGPEAAPRFVRFEHERPADHAEYARVFGPHLRFRQGATVIAFDRDLADRPQMHQHAEFYDLMRSEAQRRLDQLTVGGRSAARVRQYLGALPPSRIPDMPETARSLGMSERSLRRHLAADGTSYRDVVRDVLEASAGRLLRDPGRSIKETASALGFADAAAFHHAFKRWTGVTPLEYRRRLRREQL